MRLQDTRTLTVTAGPAFTAKWLAPRLYEFAQAHPDIELRFSASLRIMDFTRDEIDVAIRFGYGPDPDHFARPLVREWVTPTMTPEMARRYPTPQSLIDAPLIHDDSIAFLRPPCDWAAWFRAAELTGATDHGARFSQADHAIDAALSGAGVVLGRRSLVAKDLTEGRLVAPYPIAVGTKAQFRFLCPKGSEDRPQVRQFREWMIAEIESSAAPTGPMTVIPAEAIPEQ